MLADYFTKPLQGATFRKFHDAIMNCNFARSDEHPSDHRSVLDPKRANEQSHAHVPRLTQNHEQKQTESDGFNHKRTRIREPVLTLDLGTIALFSLGKPLNRCGFNTTYHTICSRKNCDHCSLVLSDCFNQTLEHSVTPITFILFCLASIDATLTAIVGDRLLLY